MSKRLRDDPTALPWSDGVLIGDKMVCAIGLGTLPCGVVYPEPLKVPNTVDFEGILTAATEAAGPLSLFLDTADTYCEDGDSLHSLERQISVYLQTHSTARIVVGTKGGMSRISSSSSGWRPVPCTTETVRSIVTDMVSASAAALLNVDASVDEVDSLRTLVDDDGAGAAAGPSTAPSLHPRLFLWQFHHLDGKDFPLADALAALDEAPVSHIGLCNAPVSVIRAAILSAPGLSRRIVSVQNEFSVWNQEAERPFNPRAAASNKSGTFAACIEAGLVFIVSAPCGGLKSRDAAHKSYRNLTRDFPECAIVAARMGDSTSAHAVYLSYLLLRGARAGVKMIIIPGARTAAHAGDSVSASRLILNHVDVVVLDAAWIKK